MNDNTVIARSLRRQIDQVDRLLGDAQAAGNGVQTRILIIKRDDLLGQLVRVLNELEAAR